MTKKQKEILATIESILPELTEEQQERLLGFGQGIVFAVKQGKETSSK